MSLFYVAIPSIMQYAVRNRGVEEAETKNSKEVFLA